MTLKSHALVATDRPERYGKQLSSHLGHKVPVEEISDGWRVTLQREPTDTPAWGEIRILDSRPGVLALVAEGEDETQRDRAADVLGRHLERFGERDGIQVTWQEGPLPE